jgi:hypothetical protein
MAGWTLDVVKGIDVVERVEEDDGEGKEKEDETGEEKEEDVGEEMIAEEVC